MTSLNHHTVSQSRRAALLFFLGGMTASWLFGSQTDEMFRILCLSCAVTSLVAVWVLLRIAQRTAQETRTPGLDTHPLETQDTLSPYPSRHLVDTTLVAILEATAKAENQMPEPNLLQMPGKYPKRRKLF